MQPRRTISLRSCFYSSSHPLFAREEAHERANASQGRVPLQRPVVVAHSLKKKLSGLLALRTGVWQCTRSRREDLYYRHSGKTVPVLRFSFFTSHTCSQSNRNFVPASARAIDGSTKTRKHATSPSVYLNFIINDPSALVVAL